MLVGLPDLDAPLPRAPGLAYRAFGRNGLIVAVPDRLRLDLDSDGRPRLLLTLVRGGGGDGVWTTGRLELGLTVECDLEGIGHAVAAEATPGLVSVAELEGGVLSLAATLGPLALQPLAHTQALPPEMLTRMRAIVELDAEAAVVAARLVDDATLPVIATLHVAFRAVAPRLPLAITCDPRVVAERLAQRLGAASIVGDDDFAAALDVVLGHPDVIHPDLIVEGDAASLDAQHRARTTALRMRERYAIRTAPRMLQLIAPPDVPSGRERIDFAEPAAVIVEQSIDLDPLAAAHAMQGGALGDLVRRIEVPPLPTGRQRISVTANLVEPIAGLLALVADVRVPPLAPFRPLAVAASVALEPPERRGEVELRLAPGERLDGEVRLRAVVASSSGDVREIAGPWRPLQRPDALLGPADFGAPLVVLRASRALLALATLDALGAGGSVLAHLDAAAPMVALPLADEALRIIARPHGIGRAIELDAGGRKRIVLDLSTLPGFGAHRARLTSADARSLLVEWRADNGDGSATQSVRIGADRPVADIGWVAASPLRPGLVWRALRHGAPGAWSAPVLPADDLQIDIDIDGSIAMMKEPIEIDGFTLRPKDDSGRGWTYVPLAPTLERGANGAPLLQVIEAGAMAFLQCTARVALNEDARDALLLRLKQREPAAQALEAAPLTVERIALEAHSGERWSALAESKGSGTAPWTAAFAATLDAGALAAIKAALAGEPHCARLAVRIVLPGSPGTLRSAERTADARIETPAGSASARVAMTVDASSPAREATAVDLDADIADFFSRGGPIR